MYAPIRAFCRAHKHSKPVLIRDRKIVNESFHAGGNELAVPVQKIIAMSPGSHANRIKAEALAVLQKAGIDPEEHVEISERGAYRVVREGEQAQSPEELRAMAKDETV